MSLLDPIAICEAVRQTVMQQDVFLAVRSDAPLGGGAGTWDDPYYAAAKSGLTESQNAALFDAIMNDATKVPAGTTVHLGPGTFCTTGSDNNGHQGWAARDGLRIVGSGTSATTLKLVNVPTGQVRWAIGMPNGSSGLNGFEASDFLVDCGFPASSPTSNAGNGAIGVHGTHVYLRRIKAINFGTTYAAALIVFAAGSNNSEDCVISDCSAENTRDQSLSTRNIIFFGFLNNSGNPHRFCVIRNCYALGLAFATPPPPITTKFLAIQPGLGVGTIIENNFIANVAVGVFGRACPTKDLVIRDNYFLNVYAGVYWDQTGSSSGVGRIIALGNTIDLSRVLAEPCGLAFRAGPYDTIIARKNIIRQIDDSGHSLRTDAAGISLAQTTNAFIDDNVINDTVDGLFSFGNAITFNATEHLSVFNNLDASGNLRRAWNTQTQTPQPELDFTAQVFQLAALSPSR